MDLKNVSTEELLKELNSRKEEVIKNAVENINNYIKVINNFGIDVEHDEENIRLLPKFYINKDNEGKIKNVLYKDVEY